MSPVCDPTAPRQREFTRSALSSGLPRRIASGTVPSMATTGREKTRENLLRRMAARQGLVLEKSRTRDPLARDFGVYWVVDPRSKRNSSGPLADMDAVESWLRR